jgi:hypothetical protein
VSAVMCDAKPLADQDPAKLRSIMPFAPKVIRADDLARAMVNVADGEPEKTEAWFSRTVTSSQWVDSRGPNR